ncbi:AAA family ATPase [Streptococcus salivarius]|uniref:AAA family ATPase n=1 Tax=Streptococcus salivarius TaxID=1304 RepID=UPI0022DFD537|nr:AAA family ATPase [Streptococcus salivarius]
MELIAIVKNDGTILNFSSMVTLKKETDSIFTFCDNSLTMKSGGFKSFKCIVGKNNEGKTFLLNEIFSLNNKTKDTYIFRRKDEDYVRLGSVPRALSRKVKSAKKSEILESTQIIKYSSTIELCESKKSNNYDISTSGYLQSMTLDQLHRIDMIKQISYSIEHFGDLFYSESEERKQKIIRSRGKSVVLGLSSFGKTINSYGKNYFNSRQKKYITELLKQVGQTNAIEKAFMYNAILTILDFLGEENYKEITNIIFKKKGDDRFKFSFDNLGEEFNKTSRTLMEVIAKKYSYFFQNGLFDSEVSFNFEEPQRRQFLKKLIEDFQRDIEIYHEIYRLFELRWKGLSSGEISLLNLLGRTSSIAADLGNERDTILLIDEVDLGLHPEWQRLWISKIRPLLSDLFSKNAQLIVTTHSPILLSDIPKSDIIYLSPNDENKETFAQNIYDLFNSSFILDNVQGEFSTNYIKDIAKVFSPGKIHDNIPKFLEKYFVNIEENSTDQFKKAIKLIGEPIVRNHFLHKLEEFQNTDKDELIRFYKKKLSELEGNEES